MHADPDGNAGERGERQQPRHEPERNRDTGGGGEHRGDADRELHGRVRRQAEPEQAGSDDGEAEPGEAPVPHASDEQHREPDARDRPSDLCEADHLTSTVALSTWPSSRTVSVYRPFCCGASKRSNGPALTPCRAPSRHA